MLPGLICVVYVVNIYIYIYIYMVLLAGLFCEILSTDVYGFVLANL